MTNTNENLNRSDTKQRSLVRKTMNLSVLGLALIAGAVYGYRQYLFHQRYETTDNAQVEGHIYLVNPRVGGQVARVLVDDNEPVLKGQTLVALDQSDFELAHAQAKSGLLRVKAELAAAAANVQAVKANVNSARAGVEVIKAQQHQVGTDLARFASLRADDVVPQSKLDNIETSARVTQAQLDAANQQHKAASSQHIAAQSRYQSLEAAIETANVQVRNAALKLSYTAIKAPYSGTISRKNVESGQVVQPGQPLMAVTDYSKIWLIANFKEVQIRKMKKGQKVVISVDTYPDASFTGKVESIAAATGAKFALLPPDNATGNFTKVTQRVPVKILIDAFNTDEYTLRPGMNAVVKVDVTSR